VKRVSLALLRWYKRHISPGLGPTCRFAPTCSEYAVDAITEYGAVRGWAMTFWRLLRCNPLNDGGYDPVPGRRRDEGRPAV
jgi:putative membrane protein insertion efficiency factor